METLYLCYVEDKRISGRLVFFIVRLPIFKSHKFRIYTYCEEKSTSFCGFCTSVYPQVMTKINCKTEIVNFSPFIFIYLYFCDY